MIARRGRGRSPRFLPDYAEVHFASPGPVRSNTIKLLRAGWKHRHEAQFGDGWPRYDAQQYGQIAKAARSKL
jgi:hypothetical protein